MRLADRGFAEMEDGSGQHGAGAALGHALHQMIERAHAATGDHRHGHRVRHGASQRQIKAFTGAVAVHRCNQQFASTQIDQPPRMFQRIDAGGLAPAMGGNFPAIATLAPPRIDRGNHALAAEACGDIAHHFGPRDGGAVHRHLVRARHQQRARIVRRADTTADGHRHEADLCRAPDHVDDGLAAFMAGADIEKAQLVRACRVISARLLDRVTGIDQIHEIDALDHAAIGHVETGNDADANGQAPAPSAMAVARSSVPS